MPLLCPIAGWRGSTKTGNSAVAPMVGDESNAEALRGALGLGAAGIGAGIGLRSLLGWRDMLARNVAKRRKSQKPAVVEVTVPAPAEKLGSDAPSLHIPPSAQMPGDPVAPPASLGDWFKGRTTDKLWAKPWFPLAAIGLPTAGIYGGYKLIDSIMDRAHARDRASELEKAKEEYRRALIEQYTTANPAKHASQASELSKDLNELVELVKQGGNLFTEGAGALAGGYLPLAALLGGGAGLATYNWVRARSPEERLAKAIKQRERLRAASRPPEIYAVTHPRPLPINNPFHEASPDDEEAVKKIAALYRP